MSNPREERRWDTNSREIQARAAAWIEERESDDWSEAREAEFGVWIEESPAHLVAFLRAETVWKQADRLKALSNSRPMRPKSGRPNSKAALYKIAAAFAVVSLAGAGALTLFQRPNAQTYTTPVGAHETLTLSDGSQIELNTDTTIRVAFDGANRNVWLDKGEAFFNVVHNAGRPFVVTLGDRRVVDLGTKFFIQRENGRVQVALLEGKARFEAATDAARQQQTILTPGDILVATKNSVSLQKKSNQDLSNELGWRRGLLIFDHATLADVAKEYNRYNQTKLVVEGAATQRLTISGALPATDIGAFTRLATKFFNLRVKQHEGAVVVSR